MSAAYDPVDAILAADEAEFQRLPLKYEVACGWHVRELWERLEAGDDCYLHGANGCGKSRGGAAYDLAKCIGLDSLRSYEGDIVPLEVLKPPVAWSISGPTYKLMDAGVLQAVRDLLGKWDWRYNAQDHYFTIRHLLAGDDEGQWSKLYVYPYDGPDPEGPRLDGVSCDEPPPTRHLDALMTRRKAGRRLHKSIRATPVDKRAWHPILSRYPAKLGVSENGRYRIQAALWDNQFIPRDQVEEELRAWGWGTERMPKIAKARLAGEHVDDSGSCPFDATTLDRWLERCREPRVERLTCEREVEQAGGKRIVKQEYSLRVFHDPVPNDVCFVVSDHGKGMSDGKHDPDEIQVYSLRYKRLVACVSEYLGGWGNGNVAVDLSERWGATWYPLVTGGYAESALSAARARHFFRVGHFRENTKPGTEATGLGINETLAFKGMARGAIEQALATDGVLCEDRETVECLKGCVIDHNGKIVGGPLTGWHDERFVCFGAACHLMGQRKAPEIVERKQPPKTGDEIAAEFFAQKLREARKGTVQKNGKARPNF